jgi:hypothetical protein
MSRSQNRNIGNKRQQGYMTPQKFNNQTICDLVDSEGAEFPVAEVRRVMLRMFD